MRTVRGRSHLVSPVAAGGSGFAWGSDDRLSVGAWRAGLTHTGWPGRPDLTGNPWRAGRADRTGGSWRAVDPVAAVLPVRSWRAWRSDGTRSPLRAITAVRRPHRPLCGDAGVWGGVDIGGTLPGEHDNHQQR